MLVIGNQRPIGFSAIGGVYADPLDDLILCLEDYRPGSGENLWVDATILNAAPMHLQNYAHMFYATRGGTDRVDEVAERAAAPLNKYLSYVGRPRPHALLLGERRSGYRDRGNTCAFLPVGQNSATFLLCALGRSARDFGLANACEEPALRVLWLVLGSPPIVALGAAAEREAHRHGLTCERVQHPAYVRRFRHAAAAEYAEEIFAKAYVQSSKS